MRLDDHVKSAHPYKQICAREPDTQSLHNLSNTHCSRPRHTYTAMDKCRLVQPITFVKEINTLGQTVRQGVYTIVLYVVYMHDLGDSWIGVWVSLRCNVLAAQNVTIVVDIVILGPCQVLANTDYPFDTNLFQHFWVIGMH